MTVLNPTKAKKSSHRDKADRTRSAVNTVQNTGNEVSNRLSHSPIPAELKKSSFGASARTSTDNKKIAKKITFEKQPAPSKQQCALKPSCSGLGSSKSPSYHQSSPQYSNTKKEEEGGEACNSDDEYGSGFLNDEVRKAIFLKIFYVFVYSLKAVLLNDYLMFVDFTLKKLKEMELACFVL
jgi:hypothetical protein